MSGRQKRTMSGCQLTWMVFIEAIAVVAAIVAITGTFWLEPNVTSTGSVLPGVANAGLWRVCYDNPVVSAEFISGNQTFDALLVELNDTAVPNTSLLADDLVTTQSTAPDTSRRLLQATANPRRVLLQATARSTSSDANRVTNASKVTANIARDFAENLPFSRGSADGCTSDMSLYNSIWGNDFYSRLQAVRGLTLVFLIGGLFKIISVILSTVFCGGARGSEGYITLLQVLAGWAGWLVFLWILLDIAGATEQQVNAKQEGVFINTKAAKLVMEYWGFSFWLFLTATLASTLGAAMSLL